ncbi:MAG TPA: hypothetical protein VGB48_06480 [Allosphingosinicella sp.]|jgi:hypothetical protein
MRVIFGGAAVALSLLLPGTALAQPASPPATAEAATEQFRAIGAWAQQITDALRPLNQAGPGFAAAIQKFSASKSPEEARTGVPEVRAANQVMRDALKQSDAALSVIEPLKEGLTRIDVNRVLTDARAQVAAMRELTDDTEAFVSAIERDDQATVVKTAPKLARAGMLMIRGQASTYRARQAMFPPSQSVHQMAGVTIRLYEAMSVGTESWFAARILKQPDAASVQRANLLSLADALQAELRNGRNNLRREKGELAAFSARPATRGETALVSAVTPMTGFIEEAFGLGDRLLAAMRMHANTSQQSLADETFPKLLAELTVLEQDYAALMARASASAANSGR